MAQSEKNQQPQEPVSSPKQRALMRIAGLDPGPYPFSPSSKPVQGTHPADLFKAAGQGGGGLPARQQQPSSQGTAPWQQPWQQPEEPEQPEEQQPQFYQLPAPPDSPLAFTPPSEEYQMPPHTRAEARTDIDAPWPHPGTLRPELQERLSTLMKEHPNVKIASGYRSPEKQAELYRKLHGHAMVARPGRSMHQFGLAADLSGAERISEAELERHGLYRPFPHGDAGHVEPLKGFKGISAAGSPWEMYQQQNEEEFGKKQKNIPSLGTYDRTPIMPKGFRGSRELVVPDERRLNLTGKGYRNISGNFAEPVDWGVGGGGYHETEQNWLQPNPLPESGRRGGTGVNPMQAVPPDPNRQDFPGGVIYPEDRHRPLPYRNITGNFADPPEAAKPWEYFKPGPSFKLGNEGGHPADMFPPQGEQAADIPGAERYLSESAEGLRRGALEAHEGAKETFTGFGERYRAAQPPYGVEAGPLGRTITGPMYRAGAAALSSPAAEAAGEAWLGMGAIPRTPGAPRMLEAPKESLPLEGEILPPKVPLTPESLGAAASPYRPPALMASETEGAAPLIRQQHGIAERDTRHLIDRIENEPLQGHNVSMAQAEARATPEQQADFRRYVDNPDPAAAAGMRERLSPELRGAADQHKHIMSEVYYTEKGFDDAEKMGYIKDYLWHAWERNGTGERAAASWLKERKIPTYEEGIAAGATPKYKYVADIDKARIQAATRVTAARYVTQALRDQGHISAEKLPGMKQLKTGAFSLHGAYAPKAIANDFNRFYAEGWDNAFTRAAAKITQDMRKIAFMPGASADAISLASGYHAVNELIESTGSELTRTLDNLFTAHPIRAGKAAGASTPGAAAAKQMVMGHKGLQIYLSKSSARAGQQALKADIEAIKAKNPDLDYIIDVLTEAHGVPSTREFLDIDLNETSLQNKMKRLGWNWAAQGTARVAAPIAEAPGRIASLSRSAWRQGGIRKAQPIAIAPMEVLRGVSGTLGTMSEPLFHFAIPRMKLGVNIARMRDWMASNPFHTREEAIRAARRISDATDNVMGEMNRDNLVLRKYMSRKAIQALDLFMLAPSWNIGSGELAVRGAVGGARALAAPVTRRIGLDPNAPSFSMASQHWDPNMSAAYGTILGSLLIAGLADWFMTGEPPQEPMDLIAPLTGTRKTQGNIHRRGEPVRLGPMGNLGWDLSAMHAITGMPGIGGQGQVPGVGGSEGLANWLINKTNPLISTGLDALSYAAGEETQGQKYRGEQPSLGGVLQDMIPFSMQPLSGAANPDLPMVARILGLREAGFEYGNPVGHAAYMRRKFGHRGKPEYKPF